MQHKRQWMVLTLVAFCLWGPCALWAHEERTPAIIDTDMALDDVRALVLMLGSSHLDIKAVVTSDGASSPVAGCENVRRVLHFLGRDHIPVAAGRRMDAPAPPWRETSEALGWALLPAEGLESGGCRSMQERGSRQSGKGRSSKAAPSSAAELTARVISGSAEKVSYICIGPLTNLADTLAGSPKLAGRIGAVYYYGTSPDAPQVDWNTGRDRDAARKVFSSPIPITSLHQPNEEVPAFDSGLLEQIQRLDSPPAMLITRLFDSERTRELLREGHFKMWDETVALYLDSPELARLHKGDSGGRVARLETWSSDAARARYVELLRQWSPGALAPRGPVVLEEFPVQPAQFQGDLRPLVPKIIAQHGLEEWKATVLTNELHRHLGIYSILGAKMGILARELLGASLDELLVESRAGSKPPLSCFNDGLQVSTGASLGRGTITVVDSGKPVVEAVFTKAERRVRLRLKSEVSERIRRDIRKTIERYGDLTPEYFAEVRRLSLEYWRDMERREIFESEWESSYVRGQNTRQGMSYAASP